MVSTVLLAKRLQMVCWSSWSVFWSTLAVASSMHKTWTAGSREGEQEGETVTYLPFPRLQLLLETFPQHTSSLNTSLPPGCFLLLPYLGICKKSPGQTQQLPLSQRQIPAPFAQLSIQATCNQSTWIAGSHSLLLTCSASQA